eukprot:7232893-Prymnesium_polylepis.2
MSASRSSASAFAFGTRNANPIDRRLPRGTTSTSASLPPGTLSHSFVTSRTRLRTIGPGEPFHGAWLGAAINYRRCLCARRAPIQFLLRHRARHDLEPHGGWEVGEGLQYQIVRALGVRHLIWRREFPTDGLHRHHEAVGQLSIDHILELGHDAPLARADVVEPLELVLLLGRHARIARPTGMKTAATEDHRSAARMRRGAASRDGAPRLKQAGDSTAAETHDDPAQHQRSRDEHWCGRERWRRGVDRPQQHLAH